MTNNDIWHYTHSMNNFRMTQSNENRNKTDDEQRILIVPVETQLRQSEDFIHSYRPVLILLFF